MSRRNEEERGAREPDRLDASGPAAPPRRNGELVFAEPWESRVFGLTMALCERGLFHWEEFRERLIAEIARWDCEDGQQPGEPAYRYYDRWQAALEALLDDKRVCAPAELDARERRLAARPSGHDH